MSPERLADADPSQDEIDAFASVFDGLPPVAPEAAGVLWSISVNREASTSVWRSRLTVKADAAARLFEAETSGIRWAVLDTGIDATHKAFRRRDANQQIVEPDPGDHDDELSSRVLRTYNFLKIKDLLDPDTDIRWPGARPPASIRTSCGSSPSDLRTSLLRGRSIDWDLLEPFLRVPHTAQDYQPPRFDSHGTHVAGILAANWQEAPQESPLKAPLVGVCPELELFDLRVLPDDPKVKADEFTIIAALQFVRHLNAHKNLMVVHGVNLSLSVPHDVANYACGRTPVCDECERVVAAGVIVVTAAGNRGFDKLRDAERRRRRRLPLHQHHRSGQRRERDHGRLDAPHDAAQLRRLVLFEPRPDRRRPHQAGPGRSGRAHRFLLAQRLLRDDGRHQHGGAACERRRGAADRPPPRADRPAAAGEGDPRQQRHRSRPRAALPGTRAWWTCCAPCNRSETRTVMLFTLEALQANDGDCLLLHYQPAGGDTGARADRRRIGRRLLDRSSSPASTSCAATSRCACGWRWSATSTPTTSPASSTCSSRSRSSRRTATTAFCQIQTLWHNSFEPAARRQDGSRAIGDRHRLHRWRRPARRAPGLVHPGRRRERAAGQSGCASRRCS